jgi:hypothetical protein
LTKAQNIIKNFKSSKNSTAIGTFGDSGGPLICQTQNGVVGAFGVFRSTQISSMKERKASDNFDWVWLNWYSPINFKLFQKSKSL